MSRKIGSGLQTFEFDSTPEGQPRTLALPLIATLARIDHLARQAQEAKEDRWAWLGRIVAWVLEAHGLELSLDEADGLTKALQEAEREKNAQPPGATPGTPR